MCLIIVAHQIVERFPLLLAANRDEFHGRPTRPSQFWPEHPQLLAGKDLEAGGTWMGITRSGRFAAVTNYRDPDATEPGMHSRGALTLNYLLGDMHATDYLQDLVPAMQDYAGFSLLVGDDRELYYLSNVAPFNTPQKLPPGIYGLSNAHLDTPWPKVTLGKTRLQHCAKTQTCDHDSLAATVSDPRLASEQELLNAGDKSNLGEHMQRLLSAQFIQAGKYGTRACTTVRRGLTGQTDWRERSFNADGTLGLEQCFQFKNNNHAQE